jgi:L-fuconolactonase
MPESPARIDAHQHFWEFRQADYPWIGEHMPVLRRDWQPQALLPELQRHRLDACIAVQARMQAVETDYLLGLADHHPWIAGVIGWVDLRADDLPRRLDAWHGRPRLRGFRHALQDEPDAAAVMNDGRFLAGVKTLQSRGLIYEVLVLQHQLDDAVKFCGDLDGHWLILDHLGKPAIREHGLDAWRRQMRPLAGMPHVMAKLSGLVTEADRGGGSIDTGKIRAYLDSALELFGAERLMFGSDWPVCLLSASYAAVWQIMADWSAKLSATEQTDLWGGTAQRAYSLTSIACFDAVEGVSPWT